MTPDVASLPRRTQPVPKAAILVAQSIVNEITEYGYDPGHRLPPEQEMIKQYGVARGTLREALRILEHHGVVRVRAGPGGGPVVQDPGAQELASTLALLLQMKKGTISSVLELRTLTEPLLSALAAERITEDQLALLEKNLDAMQQDMDDDRAFFRANVEFHELVARSSGNVLLATIVESLDYVIGRKMSINYSPRVRRAAHQAHTEILERIRAGDAQGARAAMTEHLEAIERYWANGSARSVDRAIRWQESMP